MKKLLSILGAVTLAAASTATVVACGDKKEPEEEVVEEFDYEKTLRKFLAEVRNALDNNMSKAFKDYGFIGDDKLPEGMKLVDLKTAIEEGQLADDKSDIHKLFVKFITDLIPTANINRDIQTILNNVNYNQVIVDKNSPLKEGFLIQNLQGKVKENNVTVNAEIYVSIAYKDELGQSQKDSHLINVEISVFEKQDDIDLAEKLTAIYEKAFLDTNANKFKIKSDIGNLDETAKSINTDSTLKSQLDKIFKDIETEYKEEDPMDQLKLDYSKVTIVSDVYQLVAASKMAKPSAAVGALYGHKPEFAEYAKSVGMAFGDKHDGIYEKEYIDKVIPSENSNFALQYYSKGEYFNEMMSAIEKNNNISKQINQYHLNENYKSSSLKKSLDAQNSKFEIDLEKDTSLIALVGAKIRGMQFSIGAHSYNLSNISVAVQQETTHLSTKRLYESFINDAFRFQKALGNFKETYTETGVTPVYDKFEIEVDVEASEWINKELMPDEIEDLIFNSNEKANGYAKNLGLKSKFFNQEKAAYIIYISSQGYIFPLQTTTNYTESNKIETYFYSSSNVDFLYNTVGYTLGYYNTENDYEMSKGKQVITGSVTNGANVVLKNATWSGFKLKFKTTEPAN